jgi:DUF1365 family protein
MKSCLYLGSVMHRRHKGRSHHFRYRLFWGLFDLDELPSLSQRVRLFSHNTGNLFSLFDRDHGTGSAVPLRGQVDILLAEHGVLLDGGKVFLFCLPRTLGYSFNPISLYFCHDACGRLVAVIYQVHNTFGGRHNYVQVVKEDAPTIRYDCAKDFYVSPFLDMGLHYRFKLTPPGERVSVAIRVEENGQPVLDAVLTGSALSLTDWSLLRLAIGIPAVTMKVMVAILWQSLRLRLKGITPHFLAAASATGRGPTSRQH